MAKTTEQKINDELDACYAQEGRLKREIEQHENVLVSDELKEHERIATEKMLAAANVALEQITNKINKITGDITELRQKEREAQEYKWKDIEPLIELAAKQHYMSYCVESNKFIYCMDMASKIKDDISGHEYTVVNPQFRTFEATRVDRVMSKLINKFLTDANFKIVKWFMTNPGKTHFQVTASFLYSKWDSDKVYNKAKVIQNFWVKPDTENYESYNKDFDILLYCVSGGKQENIEHLEKWPVYKYWFPERVANIPNLDICGPLGANGKGRYLELNKTIFTYGCVSPGTSKELNDGFNANWEMSTLVYFDEPTDKELPNNKVKNATGGEEQRIEKKGVDAYTSDRNYNIMALSNNEKGVFQLNGGGMAGQDRRFSVISTDIVMIDEIMRRDNCTFEEATIRVNNIAQMVKDRTEVAKWMGHIMVKHQIPLMKILPPLHGIDYHKRFEDQKDKVEMVFDRLLPIFKEIGCLPLPFIVSITNNLCSEDKKVVAYSAKTISTKFTNYLQRNRIDFGQQQRQRIKILWDGEETDTLDQKTAFYYDKTNMVNKVEFSLLSTKVYNKLNWLEKSDLIFGID
jgi:hypothetical protein